MHLNAMTPTQLYVHQPGWSKTRTSRTHAFLSSKLSGNACVLRKGSPRKDPDRKTARRPEGEFSKNELLVRRAAGEWKDDAESWARTVLDDWREAMGDVKDFDHLPPSIKGTVARKLVELELLSEELDWKICRI